MPFPLSTCSGIELAHLPATHYSGIPFSLSSFPPLIISFPPDHPFPAILYIFHSTWISFTKQR
jgi:hypothetical protein